MVIKIDKNMQIDSQSLLKITNLRQKRKFQIHMYCYVMLSISISQAIKKTNKPFYFQNIRKYKVKDDNREIAQRKRGTTLGLVFKKHSQIDAFSLINHELTGLVF